MARRDQFDVFRSLVRSAAGAARDAVKTRAPSLQALRDTANDFLKQRARLDEARLSSALAHAPEVETATVMARDGHIAVHATYTDGEHVGVTLIPDRIRFAPRGAKELAFRFAGEAAGSTVRVHDLVAVLGEEIAKTVWTFGARGDSKGAPPRATVDREGAVARLDLANSRAARALKGTPLEPFLDLVELKRIRVGNQALEIELGVAGIRR